MGTKKTRECLSAPGVVVTDIPRAAAKLGSEGELDDAGAVVEIQALSVGGDVDQNALPEVMK